MMVHVRWIVCCYVSVMTFLFDVMFFCGDVHVPVQPGVPIVWLGSGYAVCLCYAVYPLRRYDHRHL